MLQVVSIVGAVLILLAYAALSCLDLELPTEGTIALKPNITIPAGITERSAAGGSKSCRSTCSAPIWSAIVT